MQTNSSVCSQDPGVGEFFLGQLSQLVGADAGINNLAVACAEHSNGTTYYWVTRGSTERALQDVVSECALHAAGQASSRGPTTVPCSVYGLATRNGSDSAMLQRFASGVSVQMTSGQATTTQAVTQSGQVNTSGFTEAQLAQSQVTQAFATSQTQAQSFSSFYEGDILVQTNSSVCSQDPGVGEFFLGQLSQLVGADAGINNLAVACAEHSNRTTYYWVTRSSTERALQDVVSECALYAAGQASSRGPVTVPCSVYGLATRNGSDSAMLQRFASGVSVQMTSGQATTTQAVTQSGQVNTSGFTEAQLAQSQVTQAQIDGQATATQISTVVQGNATASQYAWSVVSSGMALDPAQDYASFHLLAYSINDGTRGADGRGLDYFVADGGETVSIVEGLEGASSLKIFAVGEHSVVIVSNAEDMANARFLVADSRGVRFESSPSEYSYFSLRQPLEETASQFGFLSLESEQMPGYFLRHRGFRLWLDAINTSSSTLEKRDSTFLFLGLGAQAPDVSGAMVQTASASASVTMTSVQRVSSYMQSYWASAQRVDFGACGIAEGGNGGFGERRVRTNSHGDVHIFTPDGLTYDFQAGGEFMLVASEDGSVAVQTRQTIHADDPSVSSNSAVAMLVGETVLEFYADAGGQRFYIDGAVTPMPTEGLQLPGGARIEADGMGRSGPRFIVHWAQDSFSARVNLYEGFLNVGVAGSGGSYGGLIGNLDGNPNNDILPRNATQLMCPPAGGGDLMRFGDSWRVNVDETLLRAELREQREVLVTEIGSEQRVNVETAIYQTLEQNFIGMGAETQVDVDIVAATVTSMYHIEESAAVEAVTNLFQAQGYMEVSQGLTVGTITNVVTSYRETRESRTIETLDIQRRAEAQRVCEANGIADQLALATCIMDVGLTQNEVFVESAQGFEATIVDLPRERRFTGSNYYDPLGAEVLLTTERVIELVGPPDVVPQLNRRPAVPADLQVEYVSGVPSVSLQCLGNAEVSLTGIGIVNNMLAQVTGQGEFPANCRGYDVTAANGDVLLSATCHTPDGVYASEISLRQVPAFAQMLNTPACTNRTEVRITERTSVTDITTQVSDNACDAAGAGDPAELLTREPLAGGVAVFCATHARGLTYRIEYGRTLDEALSRVAASCPPAAQAMVGRRGEVIIPCREVGRAERDFSFGGGEGGLERDVQVRVTVPLIEYAMVPPDVSLVMDPEPGLTASCNTADPVALDGISAVEGLLSYLPGTASSFQTQCFDVEVFETEGDVVLQATCFNEDGSDAQTSAISLMGVQAMLELSNEASCQPEPEPEPEPESCTADDAMGPPLPDDGLFLLFAEDGLQADFPDRGDFVLIRNVEAGIEVQARRELWISDQSESVFTAVVMVIGSDVIEIQAAPEPRFLVNGEVPEALFAEESESVTLPGGGVIRGAGAMGLEVEWPNTSFAMRVTIFAGSHLSPEIRPDPSLSYQGLVRFTSQWQLAEGESGFSTPLGGDPTCSCGQ
ncbi:VWD domain-containing protein [Pararhodobacter sp. CCB-MM2]|uniref:VWD domain-containing protein n=1 Tax=Pararhodobacter sp. CCB-MM2 TaxID=1786003 RepID=UPI0013147770|nr:VWD domain-containing protein [Pararhodobacter sp. CCB-MM2]